MDEIETWLLMFGPASVGSRCSCGAWKLTLLTGFLVAAAAPVSAHIHACSWVDDIQEIAIPLSNASLIGSADLSHLCAVDVST